MRATIDTLSEDTCDSLYSDVSVAASQDDNPALVAMPSTVDTGTISKINQLETITDDVIEAAAASSSLAINDTERSK